MAGAEEREADRADAEMSSDGKSETDAKQSDDIAELKRRLSHRETALFVLAILGFFIAAASVAVSWMQWRVMSEQSRDARTATRLEYRSWVMFNDAEIIGRLEPGWPIGIQLQIVNSGRTPATNVALSAVQTEYADIPISGGGRTGLVLAPGQLFTIDVGSRATLTPIMIQEIHNGSRAIRVRANVTYDDVFGESHFTRACFRSALGDAEIQFTPCGGHNETK